MAGPAVPAIILTPFTCGWMTVPVLSGLGAEPGESTVPVTAYLLEHPAGKAVFDPGPGPRCARAAGEPRSGPVDLGEDALIDARLRAVGVDPNQISYILSSHLHSVHAGANALLPAASVVVQQAEWQYADAGTDTAYHAPDYDTGQPVIAVTAEYDVFRDGSVVLVPTPGHTPGHQSARVQTSRGEVVLAGGACDTRRSLDELRVPARSHDPGRYRRSLTWFRARQRAGATIAFGHDPAFWATVPQSVPWNPVPPQ
jgi:glyoxylase-like metal-dependent hydrolase (beta-lactamase superfamily II)